MSNVKHPSLSSATDPAAALASDRVARRSSIPSDPAPDVDVDAGIAARRKPSAGTNTTFKRFRLASMPATDRLPVRPTSTPITAQARSAPRSGLGSVGERTHGMIGTLRLPLTQMPLEPPARGLSGGDRVVTTFRPGPDTVSAIIMAAAIIAVADGQVSDVERRSLLHFLRQKGILERKGRAAAMAAFDQAVALAVTLGLSEARAATEEFRDMADRPGAPLVVHAATLVALADGIGWPQEIALLEIIRDRLGLPAGSPAIAVH